MHSPVNIKSVTHSVCELHWLPVSAQNLQGSVIRPHIIYLCVTLSLCIILLVCFTPSTSVSWTICTTAWLAVVHWPLTVLWSGTAFYCLLCSVGIAGGVGGVEPPNSFPNPPSLRNSTTLGGVGFNPPAAVAVDVLGNVITVCWNLLSGGPLEFIPCQSYVVAERGWPSEWNQWLFPETARTWDRSP